MASNAEAVTSPPSLFRPSQFQFALALAVVRSKPPELTVREHVERLRGQIKPGTQVLPPESSHCHIAGAVYWRKLYEEGQAQIAQLRQENNDLKHEIVTLCAQLNTLDTERRPVLASDKRKKTEAEPVKDARPAKRTKGAKASNEVPEKVQTPQSLLGEDIHVLAQTGKAGTDALRHLHEVYRLCGEYTINANALAFALVQAASATATVLTIACSRMHNVQGTPPSSRGQKQQQRWPVKEQTKQDEEFASLILAMARIFVSLMTGLAKLTNVDAEDSENKTQVTYAVVKLFNTALQCITDCQVGESQSDNRNSHNAEARKETENRPRKQDNARMISQLLLVMLSDLNPRSASQRELFEGFMFVLLQRMGKRLYSWVFKHDQHPTVHAYFENTSSRSLEEMEQKRRLYKQYPENEAFYLIPILERALTVALHHLNFQPSTTSQPGKPATSSKRGSTSKSCTLRSTNVLSLDAKERLQNTLIKSILGIDSEDILKVPARLPPMPMPPNVNEPDVARWYAQELWRLVGWNILREKNE